jgi:FlaA1/EpsC-like NDP-sugar epimerase
MIRLFRHYIQRSLFVLGTVEALVLLGSIYPGVSVDIFGFNPTEKRLVGAVWPKAAAYTVLVMVSMSGVGLYQRGLRDELRGLVFRIIVAFLVATLILSVVLPFFPRLSIGRAALTTSITALFGICLFRGVVLRYGDGHMFKRQVLVIGAGQLAQQIKQLRRRSDWRDASLLGVVHLPSEVVLVNETNRFRPKERLADS